MNDEERRARGQRAQRELAETEGAFGAVEAALMREIANTPVGQDAKVLNLHKAVQNLAAVKQALLAVVQDGQVAEHAIAVAGLTRPH